ncbi:MAG: 1-acyl-sn-glycerol-3-phosphate acyltransferase [Planctomycetes bacterium]|nr:1-acyl-sn-glycerol-3-phosphate acyltransferase [Planctomycetota bacterium]
MTASLSQEQPGGPALHPTRRNGHWLTLQFVLRLIFGVWLRYRTRGIKRVASEGGGLVLVNHQSFLDPLLVGVPLQRPVSFLARDSLFPIPFVGWVLRNTYVMPINRDSASTASIRQAIGRVNDGFLVGIFPEGTRCVDGEVGELKPGFISLIRRIKQPVYPVGIAGAHEAMPRRGLLRLCPRKVHIVFGEPLCPDRLKELSRKGQEDALIEFARNAIVDCQQEAESWRQKALQQSTKDSRSKN